MKRTSIFIALICLFMVGFSQSDRKPYEKEQETPKGFQEKINFIYVGEKTTKVYLENISFVTEYQTVFCRNKDSDYFGIIMTSNGGKVSDIREVRIPYTKVAKIEGKVE